jgi:hypothetical protein
LAIYFYDSPADPFSHWSNYTIAAAAIPVRVHAERQQILLFKRVTLTVKKHGWRTCAVCH